MASEINLVPDIKNEMIKAIKFRNLVFFVCIVVVITCVVIVAIFGSIAGGQQLAVENKKKTIDALTSKLNSYTDLSDYLTIRDQLGNLATIDANKKVLSRTFNILSALLPAGADTIQISEMTVNLSGSNPTFSFDAQANAGREPYIDYNVLDSFKKSMKYMRYDYGTYVDKNDMEIPAYCMIETGDDGAYFTDETSGSIYAYWTIDAEGCNPSEITTTTQAELDQARAEADNGGTNTGTDNTDNPSTALAPISPQASASNFLASYIGTHNTNILASNRTTTNNSDSSDTEDYNIDDIDFEELFDNEGLFDDTTTEDESSSSSSDSGSNNSSSTRNNSSSSNSSSSSSSSTNSRASRASSLVRNVNQGNILLTEDYNGIEVVRIWRTPQFDEWYQKDYMSTDGSISGIAHFNSECITYAGEENDDGTQVRWTETNDNCTLVPDGDDGIRISDSSNGRTSGNDLVLRFSSVISLAPEVYTFENYHMMAIAPAGRRNVTDSYVQIQAMFGEKARDCAEGDTACSANTTNINGG